MHVHTTIIICGALVAALVFLLGFWVSMTRARTRVIYNDEVTPPESAMAKAQRAHGNSAEYAGAVIGVFILVSIAYTGRDLGLLVTSLVIAVTVGRFAHALGCLTCRTLAAPHPLKAIGAVLTYFGGAALAGLAIAKAI